MVNNSAGGLFLRKKGTEVPGRILADVWRKRGGVTVPGSEGIQISECRLGGEKSVRLLWAKVVNGLLLDLAGRVAGRVSHGGEGANVQRGASVNQPFRKLPNLTGAWVGHGPLYKLFVQCGKTKSGKSGAKLIRVPSITHA